VDAQLLAALGSERLSRSPHLFPFLLHIPILFSQCAKVKRNFQISSTLPIAAYLATRHQPTWQFLIYSTKSGVQAEAEEALCQTNVTAANKSGRVRIAPPLLSRPKAVFQSQLQASISLPQTFQLSTLRLANNSIRLPFG
jgi:hypothetical protein